MPNMPALFHLPSHLLLVYLAGILVILVPSSLVVLLHPRLRGPTRKNTRHAILSWWPVTMYWVLPCAFGPGVAILSTAMLSLAALREYLRMLPASDRHPLLDALLYLAVPLHYAAILTQDWRLIYGGVLLWGAGVLPIARMRLLGAPGFVAASGRTLFGLVVCVVALSHVLLIFLLPRSAGPAGGEGLAMFLLLFVLLNDAIQWLSGKLLGRRKITPSLSPNKTWEGLLGGLLVNLAISVPFGRPVLPLSAAYIALLAGALSVVGFVGDIYVSTIKRDLGVKDTGAVLPGQGGILDRHDSLVLNAPLFYWVAHTWFGLR